jgi:hypothetical protein
MANLHCFGQCIKGKQFTRHGSAEVVSGSAEDQGVTSSPTRIDCHIAGLDFNWQRLRLLIRITNRMAIFLAKISPPRARQTKNAEWLRANKFHQQVGNK